MKINIRGISETWSRDCNILDQGGRDRKKEQIQDVNKIHAVN